MDIVINSKDVLEGLIKKEGWDYTNIFPKGRNTSIKPSIIKSALKFLLTLFRLELYLWKRKRFDVFVTDDALVVNGWIRRIPSFIFNDNDIETIKINKILFYFATKIISPATTFLGQFENKKLSFKGNKALAHLHPKYFNYNENILLKLNLFKYQYIVVRLSKINATHDFNNTSISDSDLEKIFAIINDHYSIVISSERKISNEFQKYLYTGSPSEFSNILYFAKLFITDSATMASEAAIIGTPNVLINRVGKKCGVNKDLINNGIQFYFDSLTESIPYIKMVLKDNNVDEFKKKSLNYVLGCDDLNMFLFNTIINNKVNR